MPIYEFALDRIQPLAETTFSAMKLHERRDLQRLLRENIGVIAPGILVIAEEFGEWDDSRRRIDLLGIDRDANLVVIELKRTDDGGHMELQAIRYAAMVSTMTFDQAAEAYDRHLRELGREDAIARSELLAFLGWEEPDDDRFGQEVKIVLAAAEFGRELTTAVLWLNQHDLDIRCVRMRPYSLSGRVLVDVQQIIPPPEAAEYQVRLREKNRKERMPRTSGADHTKYDLKLGDQDFLRESKRWAILRTFRYLVESGIEPEQVAKQCGSRANRALISVEGEVGFEDFVRSASADREANGRRFDPIRFFCGEDELLRVGGRTYAFSSQWGGADWQQAMNNLRAAFPGHGIDFKPVD